MQTIQKLKSSSGLLLAAIALSLASCSKEKTVTPSSINSSSSKNTALNVSAVIGKDNSIRLEVSGLSYRDHLNAKLQYMLIEGDGYSKNDGWQDIQTEATYNDYTQTFNTEGSYISNSIYDLNDYLTTEGHYIFRLTYNVVGGGDELLFTKPTESIHLKKKHTNQHSSFTGTQKLMNITADYIAAKSYNPDNLDRKEYPNNGTAILNFNQINLRDVKQIGIETRLASNDDQKTYSKKHYRFYITNNLLNNSLVFRNFAAGETYDIKITIDGTEHLVKNGKATGIKQGLKLDIEKEA